MTLEFTSQVKNTNIQVQVYKTPNKNWLSEARASLTSDKRYVLIK
jgi:hypothetical protein